ncbi:MAG: hypothetical protein M3384_19380 [Acidobacteriota bacterium]|nr:hypothetical protein [Acidobacteriota bacterium]
MLRRVAYKKAITAGVSGALAWEIVARLLIWAGLPLFDLVYMLGSLVFGGRGTGFWQWWTAGMLMHGMVGAIWAIFYAYFFWSAFDYPPVAQGVLFSILPALLAGLIMIPQMDFMHPAVVEGELPRNGFFAVRLGLGGPAGVVLGHLIYGAILGGIYTKPVGYRVGRRLSLNV